jgi:hypothetical protein
MVDEAPAPGFVEIALPPEPPTWMAVTVTAPVSECPAAEAEAAAPAGARPGELSTPLPPVADARTSTLDDPTLVPEAAAFAVPAAPQEPPPTVSQRPVAPPVAMAAALIAPTPDRLMAAVAAPPLCPGLAPGAALPPTATAWPERELADVSLNVKLDDALPPEPPPVLEARPSNCPPLPP